MINIRRSYGILLALVAFCIFVVFRQVIFLDDPKSTTSRSKVEEIQNEEKLSEEKFVNELFQGKNLNNYLKILILISVYFNIEKY